MLTARSCIRRFLTLMPCTTHILYMGASEAGPRCRVRGYAFLFCQNLSAFARLRNYVAPKHRIVYRLNYPIWPPLPNSENRLPRVCSTN
jgi:hypothetical protein